MHSGVYSVFYQKIICIIIKIILSNHKKSYGNHMYSGVYSVLYYMYSGVLIIINLIYLTHVLLILNL
jgi:hypothetical protein